MKEAVGVDVCGKVDEKQQGLSGRGKVLVPLRASGKKHAGGQGSELPLCLALLWPDLTMSCLRWPERVDCTRDLWGLPALGPPHPTPHTPSWQDQRDRLRGA